MINEFNDVFHSAKNSVQKVSLIKNLKSWEINTWRNLRTVSISLAKPR